MDDPREPLSYDREWVIVLDDWLDGVNGSTPDEVFAQLRKGKPAMGHGPGHDEHEGDGSPSRPGEASTSARAAPVLCAGRGTTTLRSRRTAVRAPTGC
ncbi:hypothetical protein ACR6C2_05975 [Streptomyces sp. INA 01156]